MTCRSGHAVDLWHWDFARVEDLNVTRFREHFARSATFLAKPAKCSSVNRLSAVNIGILPSGIAIRKQSIAIPKEGIVIPGSGIAILVDRTAILNLGVTVPVDRTAILKLGIAIRRRRIAAPTSGTTVPD
jgi:hypothetical protein